MLSREENEVLYRVYHQVSKFKDLLENRLQKELNDLPSANIEKVQVYQGRCLALRDLLADLEAAGTMANRAAKPQL